MAYTAAARSKYSSVDSHVGAKIINRKINIIENQDENIKLSECYLEFKRDENNFFIQFSVSLDTGIKGGGV